VVQGHARLCLAQRFQEEKLLLPVGISVGEGYAPDPLLAANPGGLFLADVGFDSKKIYEEAKGKYIQMIQLKGGGKVQDPRRRETLKAFRLDLYRLRAVGEEIFGALKRGSMGGPGISGFPAPKRRPFSLWYVMCCGYFWPYSVGF